jgi:hypothetical protein
MADYGSGGWGFESLAAATKTAGQRPGTGSPGAAGAPHCDQTATTLAGTANWTATTCDHRGPVRASLWLVSVALEAPAIDRLWGASPF